MTAASATPPSGAGDRFAATRWSLVAAAGARDAGTARRALVELCLRYWYPVYAYLRGCGHLPPQAGELTRGFFEQVVQDRLGLPDAPPRGRFREYLLATLNRFLAIERNRAAPGAPVAEFEQPHAAHELERRYLEECASGLTPEQTYQRSYALEVLASALQRLRREATDAGRLAMFDALEPWLSVEPAPGECEAMATRLQLRPLAVVVALKRLRQRYRELAEAELSETVASAADLQAEREALARALQRG
jgi:hypothetical protein